MWFILVACNTEPVKTNTEVVNDTGEPTEQETSAEDTDTGTIEDTEAPVEEVEPPKIVRFVALGDGGEGNDTQYIVGASVKRICDAKADEEHTGCEFALYLGDNIYDVGVESVTDQQFYDKFEAPYAEIDFPFYVVLGNHDAGCWGAGCELYKTEYEVDYTHYSDKWTMFDQYYRFDVEHVTLFGLDTNAIMWDPWLSSGDDQDVWFDSEVGSALDWKIAFGHHPYISNGQHGNAGAYEGLDWLDWAVADVPLGTAVKDFMDARVCGQVDVYFSGHDHNRQWLEPTCGTEFIVSGAAAKTTDLQGRGNPTKFEDDRTAGFMWVEIRDNCFTGEFYDEDGYREFSHEFCK